MTDQQKAMMKTLSRWHETRVWTVYKNKSIRMCTYNKLGKTFEFYTIMPNGASIGKEFEKTPVDAMLLNIWKQLPKEVEKLDHKGWSLKETANI